MRRILIIAGTALSAILLARCAPSYPKCNNDDQCREHNEVCVQGQCVECATDNNCKQGFVCQAGKCTSECSSDTDCPGGKCLHNQCVARGACSADEDCAAGQECQGGTCVTRTAEACKFEPIHFEFDKASLTSEAERQLAADAECIKKNRVNVTLEGHADERGTEEYNLQLSNRRAASVKKYLSDLGVSGGSLDTVGYGFNRPAVQGHNEAAWAANRRVEFSRK